MSFRLQPAPLARPNRCQLFGPGSNTKLFAKMAASVADVINLDLEDSVAPSDKDTARANVIEAINTVDWGNKTLSVRINGLDTPYWYRDVVDVIEQAGDRLDQIMIPKVGCAADVYAVDALVTAIERATGRGKPVTFEVIIESAAGIAHVEDIAASSPRMAAMSLGAADFAASMGMQTTGIGGTQIALANEVFTPSAQAVAEAREILAAMEDAKARGEGATVYKGRLVDIASIKQAEVIVKQSEMIAG